MIHFVIVSLAINCQTLVLKRRELQGRVSCISLVLEHQRGTLKPFLFRPLTRGSSTRDPVCIFTLHCKVPVCSIYLEHCSLEIGNDTKSKMSWF